MTGDGATIEKDALALIEFRLGLDRERERVPFFERVDVAVERNDGEVVAGAGVRVIVGPQECLERLVARREVLLGIVCGTSSSKNLMPRRKVCGCPLTPRLMANPRKPLRVSASMSIAISATCVPAIAFTRNRVSPCETRKIRAPLPSIGHAIIGGCRNLSSDLRGIARAKRRRWYEDRLPPRLADKRFRRM